MSDVGRVGFIGLGQIGAPMAERLLAWPGGLTVFDVRPEAAATCVEGGARLASSPSDLAAECDVISVMVRDDAQVRDVLTGADGILGTARAGTVVAVHSTIGAETAIELEVICGEHGVALVDAPVSGGFIGAAQGNLAVLVGGPDDAVVRCEGPFGCFAGLVTHFGPIGSGTRAKLARNLLHFIAFSAAGEAQRLAEAAGLSLTRLARVVRHTDAITGGPGAIMLRRTTEPMAADDPLYGIMVHTRELGEKDLHLALALADEFGVELPLGRLAEHELAAALGVPHESTEEQ